MLKEYHADHDDHGNTLSAWFLTVSWIVVWAVAGVAIIAGKGLVLWTMVALVGSVICSVVAGVMKKAGMGRTAPRPVPMTMEEYEALRSATAASVTDGSDKATAA